MLMVKTTSFIMLLVALEQRQGNTGPRMPLDRMPFGLIAHNLKFFASDNVSNLQAPDDYKSWCQSMYTLFGNKWASMHLGPMWSYEVSENISATANANDGMVWYGTLYLTTLTPTVKTDFQEGRGKKI